MEVLFICIFAMLFLSGAMTIASSVKLKLTLFILWLPFAIVWLLVYLSNANAETLNLSCAPPPDADLATTTIYQSKAADFAGAVAKDAGKTCAATVTTNGIGGDYFKATAKDTSGNESAPSNVLFVPDAVAPQSPTGLKKN